MQFSKKLKIMLSNPTTRIGVGVFAFNVATLATWMITKRPLSYKHPAFQLGMVAEVFYIGYAFGQGNPVHISISDVRVFD